MAALSNFYCSTCRETFVFSKKQRQKHRRRCTYPAINVAYEDLNRSDGKQTTITVFRQPDGLFSCFRCYEAFDDSKLFNKHTRECRKIVNIFAKEGVHSLPPTPVPTPRSSSFAMQGSTSAAQTLYPNPGITSRFPSGDHLSMSPSPPPAPSSPPSFRTRQVAFDCPPSSSPASSAKSSSTSTLRSPSMSPNFDFGLTILPAPLVPPSAPMPMAVQAVAQPLLDALGILASTCPLCWIRGFPNEHSIYSCSIVRPKALAPDKYVLLSAFKSAINCPPGSCAACLIPLTFAFDIGNGQSARFHGKGHGFNGCRFVDAILPILHYVFNHRPLRQLLNAYGILGPDFSNTPLAAFATWLVAPTPQGHLPSSLLILHTVINKLGMPPIPDSDNGSNFDSDNGSKF